MGNCLSELEGCAIEECFVRVDSFFCFVASPHIGHSGHHSLSGQKARVIPTISHLAVLRSIHACHFLGFLPQAPVSQICVVQKCRAWLIAGSVVLPPTDDSEAEQSFLAIHRHQTARTPFKPLQFLVLVLAPEVLRCKLKHKNRFSLFLIISHCF